MPKGSGAPTGQRPPPADGAGLQAEVKAFASSLGLAAADSTGFNDSDFRPEVAKRKFSEKGGQQKRVRGASGEHADGDAATNGKKRARTAEHPSGRAKPAPRGVQPVPQQHRPRPQDDKAAAALKSREWREGVGPRPGKAPCTRPYQCTGVQSS